MTRKTAQQIRIEHYGENDSRSYEPDEIKLMEIYAEQFKIKKKTKPTEEKTLHVKCREVYESWCAKNDKVFDWSGLQGKALNLLIKKIKKGYSEKFTTEATNETIIEAFDLILQLLPEWYKNNNFSISTINSKYANIISQIKLNGAASKSKGGFNPDSTSKHIANYLELKARG